jgi:hypothetical protein
MENDPDFQDYDQRVQDLLPEVRDSLIRAQNSQKGKE